jgi:hypothetical protein
MLAIAQCGMGRIIASTVDAGSRNIVAHATQADQDRTVVTLINKEAASDAVVGIEGAAGIRSVSVVRLSGPSLESKSGITLAGEAVLPTGTWKAARVEEAARSQGKLKVRLPAASAALVTLHA